MNIWMYVSFLNRALPFYGYITRSRIDQSYGNLIVRFWQKSILLFTLATLVYIPVNSVQVSFCLHPSRHVLFMLFLMIIIQLSVRPRLIAILIWISLMTSNTEHFLIFLLLFTDQVVSESLWFYGLQHTRLPCPSAFSGVCPISCPLSSWHHPTISSSVVPFSSCPQSFSASWSFPVSWLFASGSQNIEGLASASILSMNIQDWFPLGLTDLICWLSKGFSRVFSSTTIWKQWFFGSQTSLWSKFHIHAWLLEKP